MPSARDVVATIILLDINVHTLAPPDVHMMPNSVISLLTPANKSLQPAKKKNFCVAAALCLSSGRECACMRNVYWYMRGLAGVFP